MTPASAMQEALRAEHAALYVYGVLGARTSASAEPELFASTTAAYRRHRARRDRLRAFLQAEGAEPVPAEVAYETPTNLGSAAGVRSAASALERSSAEVMAALVAQTTDAVRRWAAAELVWSATWQVGLGEEPSTWPGAPELEAWAGN